MISKSAELATGGLLRLSQGCFPGFPAGFPAHNVYDMQARDLDTSDGACGTQRISSFSFLFTVKQQ